MDNLKKFQVTMQRTQITVFTHTFEVEAEDRDDARVLAKYQDIPSWRWEHGAEVPERYSVTSIIPIATAPSPLDDYTELAREAAERTGETPIEGHLA